MIMKQKVMFHYIIYTYLMPYLDYGIENKLHFFCFLPVLIHF